MSERRKPNRDLQRTARTTALEDRLAQTKAWLKSIHFRYDAWTILPGEKRWISDPGRRDVNGRRVMRLDGLPWGEPSWQVGDLIGLYFTGTLRVPLVVEVAAPPEFNPKRVQAENDGGEPDAGERWPWLTVVRGVGRTDLATAPGLDDLGIDAELMRRRSKLALTPAKHKRLVRAFCIFP